MQALIEVILPVFLVIGFGYWAVWRGYFSDEAVTGLMKFTQNFAIPCLLFSAISNLDLGQSFDWRLLVSFYTGSLSCFVVGMLGARLIFGRDWEDAVVIGFACLFANSVLLGLAITERAYGVEALAPNYAIVALHSPFAYGLGITTMEIIRARGKSPAQTARTVLTAIFRNALILGIALGFAVNLTGFPVPGVLTDAIDLMVRAALPAAIFGLGGVLYRYRPEGDMRTIFFVCAVSLLLHPTITWTMGTALKIDEGAFRSAVLTAAMAPGVNAYVFANLYGRARRVAASSVLLATGLCVFTSWVWLALLG